MGSGRRGAARKAWTATSLLGLSDGSAMSPAASPVVAVDIGGVTALRMGIGFFVSNPIISVFQNGISI